MVPRNNRKSMREYKYRRDSRVSHSIPVTPLLVADTAIHIFLSIVLSLAPGGTHSVVDNHTTI